MKRIVFCLLILSLTGVVFIASAQTPIADSLAKKIALYHTKTNVPTLFVHFDKTVYTANEQVWFTGYLLDAGTNLKAHSLLLVSLVRNSDRKVITSAKFVMQEGISSGSMVLPDSIPAGHYTLTAYTNLLESGRPQDVFEQQVTIKTADLAAAKLAAGKAASGAIVAHKSYSVKFYPEGGNMVVGLPSRIGFEVMDNTGTPVNTKGVILHYGEIIDTVETTVSGMGDFYMMPESGGAYSFRFCGKDMPDTAYLLPQPARAGITMTVSNAMPADTLKIRVANEHAGKLTLVVHNYNDVFYVFTADADSRGKLFKIDLKNVPKGLAEVTILNEQLQPLAGRIFFAHYDPKQNNKLNIGTDKTEYAKRAKVTLHVKLNDANLQNALVSVAVVQANRTEELNKQDIGSYYYLKHKLASMPYRSNYFGNTEGDKTFLENVLLIKGWLRYKWSDIAEISANDTARRFSVPEFTGRVTKDNGKPFKKPTGVVLIADSATHVIMADAEGRFVVKPDLFTIGTFKHPFFLQQEFTAVNFNDPYVEINKQMAKNAELKLNKLPAVVAAEDFKLSSLEFTKQLKEVTIKSGKDNSIYGSSANGSNSCGDYVCSYNILNCRNHPPGSPGNHPPENGALYMTGQPGMPMHMQAYTGCTIPDNGLKRKLIDAIYEPMDFYGMDSLFISNPTPQYLSTVYWKNLMMLPAGKPVDISFYTGDITGAFKIIVQGVAVGDVVYGEGEFVVK